LLGNLKNTDFDSRTANNKINKIITITANYLSMTYINVEGQKFRVTFDWCCPSTMEMSCDCLMLYTAFSMEAKSIVITCCLGRYCLQRKERS